MREWILGKNNARRPLPDPRINSLQHNINMYVGTGYK